MQDGSSTADRPRQPRGPRTRYVPVRPGSYPGGVTSPREHVEWENYVNQNGYPLYSTPKSDSNAFLIAVVVAVWVVVMPLAVIF